MDNAIYLMIGFLGPLILIGIVGLSIAGIVTLWRDYKYKKLSEQ